MPRVPRVALALAAVLALTACGPEKKVTLGVRDVATDILLTGATPPPTPGVPPATPPKAPPGFPFVPTPVAPADPGFVPLPPPPSPSVAPPPATCPTAPAFVAPRYEATPRPVGAPVPATYGVRTGGEYEITGANAGAGVYPPAGTRVVKDVAALPGDAGWTYVVADDTGLATTYQVVPRQVVSDDTPVDSQNQPVPTQPGIYVSQFAYQRTDGTVLTLDPEPSVMVAKLPFAPGDKWTSRGVDSKTGVTVIVNGQTGIGADFSPARARVDACGTLLDAWWVEYTVDTTPVADQVASTEPPSQLQGPDLLVRFSGSRVAFAPQFGGLPVEELYTLAGTDAADGLTIRRHMVYSREPALAVAP